MSGSQFCLQLLFIESCWSEMWAGFSNAGSGQSRRVLWELPFEMLWLSAEVPGKKGNIAAISWKGTSGELQACKRDLGAGESCGTDHVECNHTAGVGQLGDQAQTAWFHVVLPEQPHLLL